MRTLNEIMADELEAANPWQVLEPEFDDYDLEAQAFCEFQDMES